MFRIKPFHVLLAVFIISIASCTKNDTAFTIGDNLIDIKSNVISVDTTSINTYTMKLDSVVTSDYAFPATKSHYALTGRYTDGMLGTITASSYFKLGITLTTTLEENAKYDSISLVIKPTNYSYGDTTKPFTLQVHKLVEEIANTEFTYRYSTSKLRYDSALLGSKTLKKKPLAGQKLFVRLSDIFGSALFRMVRNESDTVANQTNFSKYFKGVAITTDTTTASAIYRFDISTDSVSYIRVHYHVGPDPKTIDFKLINGEYQFNRIESDYSLSPLKALKKKTDLLSSRETNNESYCQAGTGIMTKIEFPNLKSLFQTYENYKVLSAYLVIKPVRNTYKEIPLPYPIYLYYTNILNDVGNRITYSSSSTSLVTPTFNKDLLYNEETSYIFDVTYYLNNVLKNLNDTPPALILSLPTDNLGYSTDRLIIGNRLHPTNDIRLKITFWKY
jgi:hypothetical protein